MKTFGLSIVVFAVASLPAVAGPLKGMGKKLALPAAVSGNPCAELKQCWDEALADPKLAQFHPDLQKETGQIQYTLGQRNPALCIQIGQDFGQLFVGIAEEMNARSNEMDAAMGMKPGDFEKMLQASMEMAKASIPKTAEEREAALAQMPEAVRDMTRQSWDYILSGEQEQLMAQAIANDPVKNALEAKWPESCPWAK
tara:strand:+ start:73 stop:666 length:594 start_codon:yes stop_codon:yes gene_type:complete